MDHNLDPRPMAAAALARSAHTPAAYQERLQNLRALAVDISEAMALNPDNSSEIIMAAAQMGQHLWRSRVDRPPPPPSTPSAISDSSEEGISTWHGSDSSSCTELTDSFSATSRSTSPPSRSTSPPPPLSCPPCCKYAAGRLMARPELCTCEIDPQEKRGPCPFRWNWAGERGVAAAASSISAEVPPPPPPEDHFNPWRTSESPSVARAAKRRFRRVSVRSSRSRTQPVFFC